MPLADKGVAAFAGALPRPPESARQQLDCLAARRMLAPDSPASCCCPCQPRPASVARGLISQADTGRPAAETSAKQRAGGARRPVRSARRSVVFGYSCRRPLVLGDGSCLAQSELRIVD